VDILLKQRLVGAIVLISLGVIFIPMLLSGKGDLSSSKLQSNIPPEPAYDIRQPQVKAPEAILSAAEQRKVVSVTIPEPGQKTETAKEPPKPRVQTAEKTEKTATAKLTATQPHKQSSQTAKPAAKKTTSKTTTSKTTTSKTTTKTESKTGTKSDNKIATKSTSTSAKPAPAVSGWVVQVGSFEQRANANHLRDKLRKRGYPGFVEPRRDSRDTVYRVRVGPTLKRAEAETLQKKLLKREKLKGLVMHYPAHN
jgi:DedD protein